MAGDGLNFWKSAAATPGDPNWGDVVLLLDFEGGPTDKSPVGATITQSSFGFENVTDGVHYVNGESSGRLFTDSVEGVDGFLTAPYGPQFDFGDEDWTIEGFLLMAHESDGFNVPIVNQFDNEQDWAALYLNAVTAVGGKFALNATVTMASLATPVIAPVTEFDNNVWYFFQLKRNGTVLELWFGGVMIGSVAIGAGALFASTGRMSFGDWNGWSMIGSFYLDDVRITKGLCRPSEEPTGPWPTE